MDWAKYDEKVDVKGLKEDVKNASDDFEFEEVPEGVYEVQIDKAELKQSKSGKPMVSIWFKIVAGKFNKSMLFYNAVVERGFQIKRANAFMQSLEPGFEVEFDGYQKYSEVVLDVAEACSQFAYQLKYSKNAKGYSEYEIQDIFE